MQNFFGLRTKEVHANEERMDELMTMEQYINERVAFGVEDNERKLSDLYAKLKVAGREAEFPEALSNPARKKELFKELGVL